MEPLMQEFIKSTKDIQTFWENRFAQVMEEMVKSQNFVNAMTKSLEGSLDLRRLVDSSMGRWAEFYQVVTKKDLALIQQQMFDQGVRMEKMVTLLETIRDHVVTGTPRPAEPEAPKAARKTAGRGK
ncbi:MAG: hypothetical protein GX442_05790 [Candidatus Riflebacteria bacterium]|nr:hypothetical protein [Candidatus Riflebacteria bacterium]